jgi:hypothetical protein
MGALPPGQCIGCWRELLNGFRHQERPFEDRVADVPDPAVIRPALSLEGDFRRALSGRSSNPPIRSILPMPDSSAVDPRAWRQTPRTAQNRTCAGYIFIVAPEAKRRRCAHAAEESSPEARF